MSTRLADAAESLLWKVPPLDLPPTSPLHERTTEGGSMTHDDKATSRSRTAEPWTTLKTQGATIMSATDTLNEGVITSYAQAPARTITAGGVTYAYRELGPKGGIPVIFFVHLAATLDNWDPRIIDSIAKNHHVIAFDNRGVGASTGQLPDTVEAMPTTPTPSSRPSGSARSTSSPSPSAASSPRHSS